MIREDLSLRETARELDIEPSLLLRLCRYLNLDPHEQRIPLEEIRRIQAEGNVEARYAQIRSLLIRTSHERRGYFTQAPR